MDDNPQPLETEIDGRRIVRWVFIIWVTIELSLVALDTIVNYGRMAGRISEISQFRKMANLAREDGMATWFSSTQMLLVAFSLGLVTWRLYLTEGAKWRMRGWALVTAFFSYMAFDDASKIHERVATASRKLMAGRDGDTDLVFAFFPSYTWQLVYGPMFVGMALFMLFFFYKEMNSWRYRLFIIAGLACYTTAVGIDFVEGIVDGYVMVGDWLGSGEDWAAHYGRVLEEFLEMLGTTFFLASFLGHFSEMCGPVTLRFKGATSPPPAS